MNYRSKIEEDRRMKKLHEQTRNNYGTGCYANDKRGGRLVRWYPYSTNHKNVKKWFRRYSNRRFRRNKDDIFSRCWHKKQFDLWWTLF